MFSRSEKFDQGSRLEGSTKLVWLSTMRKRRKMSTQNSKKLVFHLLISVVKSRQKRTRKIDQLPTPAPNVTQNNHISFLTIQGQLALLKLDQNKSH